jgi:predicted dehydrogenase
VISRVLIVGLGSIGQRHLRLARQLLPSADIRVLRHQPSLVVPEFADGCFYTLEHALAFAPELAVIANPATQHIPISQRLAEKGCHLLIEKPLAASNAGVTELISTARQHLAVLQTGYNLRFLDSLSQFRTLLHAGRAGKVLSVRCEIGQYLPSWRPGSDYRQGVSARHELGGGALLELSHELDYLRWIFGEVAWVQATLSKQSQLEIDVEDCVSLQLGFTPSDDGSQLLASVNLDFIRHDTTRLCTAIGEKATLRWNGLTGAVEIYEAGDKQWQTVFSHQHQRDDSYLAEWQHFLRCIKNGESPLISAEDGLRVLDIVQAARESSASGCRVNVNVS